MAKQILPLKDSDYTDLADFRAMLRNFQAFSEGKATEAGLTPQQHQALLAIRGANGEKTTVGYIAERLILKPHTASELVNRLEALDFVTRKEDEEDRRKFIVQLTEKAEGVLASLSTTHREEIRRLKPLLLGLLDRFG